LNLGRAGCLPDVLPRRPAMKSRRGFQLIELMAVVAILAIVALVALPNLSATDPASLDLAAQEVADALRFARSEAIRTGQVQGVLVNYDGSQTAYKDIAVYRVDTTVSPFGIAALLAHPVDKQPYNRQVVGGPQSIGIRFANTTAPFTFSGVTGSQLHLHFNAYGMPILMQNGVPYRLVSGAVLLRKGQNRRSITVQPITGRVTVE
jgi:prepilin-type N-terminal cleavage/methylation domain-containing protein